MVLSILSYRLGRHINELAEMKNFMKVEIVTDKATAVDLARVFQFLAFNYQELFPESREGEGWMFFALQTTIGQASGYPSLAYAALDFISNTIALYFSETFALSYMKQCSLTTHEMQFKIFIKIISKHAPAFSD
jgi:hypothetical protein